MNLNELRDKAYKIACEHGFHDKKYSNEHLLMLIITDISESIVAWMPILEIKKGK